MPRKFLLIIFLLIFLFDSHTAFAGVIINEVQLLPTADRFIELYNTDNTEVDLTDYYIQRKTQTGTSFTSLVSKTNFVNKKISANDYFLISRSAVLGTDIVLNTLTLTDSNILQIKNGAGEVVNSFCFGDVIDCTPPVPNPPEGQSVGRVSGGSLAVGNRSPGLSNQTNQDVLPANEEIINSNGATESTSNIASAGGGNTSPTPKIEEKSITTKVKTKSVSFLGLPLTFEVKSYGTHGEELNSGKYFWNFGDGTTEERTDNLNFTHIYTYAGEYLVSVEYFANNYSSTPDVLNKVKIKVVPIELSISRTGDVSDFFVEITNNSSYDIDVSSWKLSAGEKVFTFPRNTNILAKKKIILSSVITKFAIEDKSNLKLSTQADKVVYQVTPEVKIVEEEMETQEGQSSLGRTVLPVAGVSLENKNITDNSKISEVNLLASASDAPIFGEDSSLNQPKTSNSYIFPMILFVFLFTSGGAVYFIRRNNKISKIEDDFEILDE